MTSTLPGLQNVNSESMESENVALQPDSSPTLNLEALNQKFDQIEANQLIEWSSQTFGKRLVMSTSFGIQSAVMLKLVTSVVPDIPVIWVDTGYLPPETYRFAQQLTQRLSLNLKVYQSPMSPARMEALYGRLWEENSVEALNRYDQIRKVEPMDRALAELGAAAWLTGLRAGQTDHRKTMNRLEGQGFAQEGGAARQPCYKLMPILHWSSKEVYDYLMTYDLPYHPLWDQGYVSVGDWHSSRPLTADDVDERSTRFNGLKQECGIHIPQTPEEAESLDSSSL